MRWRTALMVAAGIVAAVPLATFLWSGEAPRVSDDLAALQNTVAIPDGATSARWEIFGTPEYKGGVPGPTDYLTLIAELQPASVQADHAAARQDDGIAIVPEAARPWLSDGFRALMEQNRNARLHLSAHKNCQPYRTTVRKSGRQAEGFVCTFSNRTLLYLDVT